MVLQLCMAYFFAAALTTALDLLARQASEQYLTSSQFLAQLLRQVISLPQTTHGLLGRLDLFPLKPMLCGQFRALK